MNNMEIERKFLIKKGIVDLPLNKATDVLEITQGYLCVNKQSKDEVRLRMTICNNEPDPTYTITAKKGTGMVRGEYESHLDIWQFGMLWKAIDKQITKKRYRIPHLEYVIELDVFEGNLQGLIIAEVEFRSEEEALKFVAPEWFGESEDVTSDPRYKNQSLIERI